MAAVRVRRLLSDVTELAELQVRLVAGDAKCLAESTVRPIFLGAFGLAIVLGSIPVFLISAANYLVDQYAWTPA